MHDFSALPDIDAGRMPVVQISATNEAMADSRDVAAYFDKNHRDVLRNIRELHCSPSFRERNFAPFKNNDLAGETTAYVNMTKDGFTFLAMGFTGAKAAIFKERYIEQFNVMESELRRRVAPARMDATALLDDPDALRAMLLGYTAKVSELKAEVATLAPKAEFVDRYVSADGLHGYHNAARELGCGPQKFCRWLKLKYCFGSAGALMPKAQYVEQGLFAVRTFIDDAGTSRARGYVTAKGIEYFSSRIPSEIKVHQPASALPAAATAH